MTIAGVILAAGAGSRFEGTEHKLLADFRGRPMVAWTIQAALDAGFNQLYVVTGAVDLERSLAKDPNLGLGPSAGITWLDSPDWQLGQSHSLRVAVLRARADGHRALVVGLGDQPLVPSSAWRSVGAARGPITIAEFEGERRPPVKLEDSVWDLLPREGDLGAREVIRLHPELVSAVPCGGNPADIDTKRDLRRWS